MRKVVEVFFYLLLIMALITCSGSKNKDKKNSIIVPEKYRGIYYNLSQNESGKWLITSEGIIKSPDSISPTIMPPSYLSDEKIEFALYDDKIVVKQDSENILDVTYYITIHTGESSVYYFKFIRDIEAKFGTLKGAVVGSTGTKKGMSKIGLGGLGSVEVVITDVNDPSNSHTTITDSNGDFQVDGLPLGVTYEVSNGTNSQRITMSKTFEDMGYLPTEETQLRTFVVNDQNLYTELSGLNKGIVSCGPSGQSEIRFFIIKQKGYSSLPQSYTIDIPNLYPNSLGHEIGIDDAFKSGAQKYISDSENYDYYSFMVELQLESLAENYIDKIINIEVLCDNGDVWKDRVSLRIYKTGVRISTQQRNLMVFGKDGSPIYYPAAIGGGFRTVPYLEEQVVMALGGDEGNYSIGINHSTYKFDELYLDSFSVNENIYEPNDSYQTASAIFTDFPVVAYMDNGGIDFYKFIPFQNLISSPSNINASDGDSGKVIITWDSVPGADSYYVYRTETSIAADETIASDSLLGGADFSQLLTVYGITGTVFEDATAVPSQYYYYHVKAYSSTTGYSSFIGGTMNKGWAQ